MSRQRPKENFEAITCKVNLGRMSSDTWGIRCHVRGAGCRKACGGKKLWDVKGGGKLRGEIKLVSAHFGNWWASLFNPCVRKLVWSGPCCPPEPPVAPPARSRRGNWIREELFFFSPWPRQNTLSVRNRREYTRMNAAHRVKQILTQIKANASPRIRLINAIHQKMSLAL